MRDLLFALLGWALCGVIDVGLVAGALFVMVVASGAWP